jgi:hypothetical protein
MEESSLVNMIEEILSNSALGELRWPHFDGKDPESLRGGGYSERNLPKRLIVDNYEVAAYFVGFNSGSTICGFQQRKSSNGWIVTNILDDLPRMSNLVSTQNLLFLSEREKIQTVLSDVESGILLEVEYFPGIRRIGFFDGISDNHICLFQEYNKETKEFRKSNKLDIYRHYFGDINPHGLYLPDISLDKVQRVRILK